MIWSRIASFILKFRVPVLIIMVALTGFMGWKIQKLQLDYGYSGMLPDSDSISIKYQEFQKTFGDDGTLFFFGFTDPQFYTVDKFNDFNDLKREILGIHGINSVMSVYDALTLKKNTQERVFELNRVFPDHVQSQSKLDSLVGILQTLPIYRGLVHDDNLNLYIMVMTIDSIIINTSDREQVVDSMMAKVSHFEKKYKLKVHYSGLPYVRTALSVMIQKELIKFLILAALVTMLILFVFFRSLVVVFFSTLVVSLGVAWALGLIVIFDYRITVLSGMIPAVLIVIGIPNTVFLLNRYHQEYKKHKNKIKALHRVIQKVGNAIFMTNITTAAGFATFIVIKHETLHTFGIVASIGIVFLFLLSITLIPIIFSFLPSPNERHIRHLDNKPITMLIAKFAYMVQYRRKVIYWGVAVMVLVAAYGITKMRSTGYILDDIPKNHPISVDMRFFEKTVKGVMPLEVAIDTHHPNGVFNGTFLKNVDRLQDYAESIPEISQSFSLVDGLKFARQAYYNGDEKYFKLPSNQERAFLLSYLKNNVTGNLAVQTFVDSTNQIARVSMRIADVGTYRMLEVVDSMQLELDRLFPAPEYTAILTGSSLRYTLGTQYLVRNLFVSLGLAILFIAIFMAWMFRSGRMVFITIFANLLPLIFTAGLMGFVGISIKPSTVLVFSVTFGIAVDTAIHYLAKYRQELVCPGADPAQAIIKSLKDVGVSIIYSVCILFVGFGIFVASDFGGTVAMGILVSITLFVAVIANLLLVPSILLGRIERMRRAALSEKMMK